MSKPWISEPTFTDTTILDVLYRVTGLPFTEYINAYNTESRSYTVYCKLYDTTLTFQLPHDITHIDSIIIAYIAKELRLNYPELYI